MASETHSCPHKMAAEEVAKGQWVMTQLQCLMLLEDGPDLAGLLLEQALFFSREALGMLTPCDCDRFPSTVERRSDTGKTGKFSGRKTELSSLVEGSSADVGRRKTLEHRMSVTTAPHFDGYQWKKYGQKTISNSRFPRSYYRCKNFKEQGCLATKTVQKKDDNNGKFVEFIISYRIQHTCKSKEVLSTFVVESTQEQNRSLEELRLHSHALLQKKA